MLFLFCLGIFVLEQKSIDTIDKVFDNEFVFDLIEYRSRLNGLNKWELERMENEPRNEEV